MPALGRGEGTRIVGRYMRQSPGIQIHFHDIAKDTGLELSQVNNALSQMCRNGDQGIYRVKSGVYIYRPETVAQETPQNTGPKMYEEVGTTKAGERVIRDENGILWKLSGEF